MKLKNLTAVMNFIRDYVDKCIFIPVYSCDGVVCYYRLSSTDLECLQLALLNTYPDIRTVMLEIRCRSNLYEFPHIYVTLFRRNITRFFSIPLDSNSAKKPFTEFIKHYA